jgi:hypothetical protein
VSDGVGDRIENVLVGLAEEGWEEDEGRMAVSGGREALRNALGLMEPGRELRDAGRGRESWGVRRGLTDDLVGEAELVRSAADLPASFTFTASSSRTLVVGVGAGLLNVTFFPPPSPALMVLPRP